MRPHIIIKVHPGEEKKLVMKSNRLENIEFLALSRRMNENKSGTAHILCQNFQPFMENPVMNPQLPNQHYQQAGYMNIEQFL